MDNKNEQLINIIKQWVKIDNDIREIKKEEKARKETKKKLTLHLIEIMKHNNIDCVDINNGQLCYTYKNVKKPLTNKNLKTILSKYYKGNITKATEMNDYILDSREDMVKESIVRKITNN
jgi:hypothetical protein